MPFQGAVFNDDGTTASLVRRLNVVFARLETYLNRPAPVVYVDDYVAPGATTHTAAVQSAINDSNGRPIQFGEGTYSVGTLTGEYGVTFLGMGKYKTILQRTGAVPYMDIATAYNRFQDLSFDMVGSTYTTVNAFTFTGVADLCTFDRCSFDNIPTGVAAVEFAGDEAKHLQMRFCTARGVSATAVMVKQTGNDTSAQQRKLTGCDAAGMRVFDFNNVQAVQVEDCLGTDIVIGSDSTLGLEINDCNLSGDFTLKGIRTYVTGGRFSGTVTLSSGFTFSTYVGNNEATLVNNTTTDDSFILAYNRHPAWQTSYYGALSKDVVFEEEITLSTSGTTTDSSANLIPANCVILGVTARITTTIGTATDWSVGDSATPARFMSANSTLTAGTTSVGLNHLKGGVATDAAGPTQVSAAPIRITTTGTPSAGKIRITVFARSYVAATA